MTSLQKKHSDHVAAYTKSGAYAEQALNAIKVVSAFGQEQSENKAYTSFLDYSKKKGMYSDLKTVIGFSMFNFLIL